MHIHSIHSAQQAARTNAQQRLPNDLQFGIWTARQVPCTPRWIWWHGYVSELSGVSEKVRLRRLCEAHLSMRCRGTAGGMLLQVHVPVFCGPRSHRPTRRQVHQLSELLSPGLRFCEGAMAHGQPLPRRPLAATCENVGQVLKVIARGYVFLHTPRTGREDSVTKAGQSGPQI